MKPPILFSSPPILVLTVLLKRAFLGEGGSPQSPQVNRLVSLATHPIVPFNIL